MLPNIKLYYKARVITTAWYWYKNRRRDQWNRIESPKINLQLQSQLIFDRGSKHISWTKDSSFNKRCWENQTDMCRKIKLDHLLTPHMRINSKWIKDKSQTQNHKNPRRKHRQQNLVHYSQQFFIRYISPGKGNKEKINKWDYSKLKSLCTAKENINKVKRQPTEWKNIFANTSDKGLISKIDKVLTKLNTKKNKQPN